MHETPLTIQGTVRPDGSLILDGPLPLPAGRVQVTVEPLPEGPVPDRFWKMMAGIWADLQAGGHVARTREQIDSDIASLRNESDEELREAERLHDDCRPRG